MWLILKDIFVPKHFRALYGEDIKIRNYLVVFLDKTKTSIVRIVQYKEFIADVISEAKMKSYMLAVYPHQDIDL
jgi:hypothetical protein